MGSGDYATSASSGLGMEKDVGDEEEEGFNIGRPFWAFIII